MSLFLTVGIILIIALFFWRLYAEFLQRPMVRKQKNILEKEQFSEEEFEQKGLEV